jgi:hypothetical protein
MNLRFPHKKSLNGEVTLRRACGSISSGRDEGFLAFTKAHKELHRRHNVMTRLQFLLLTQWKRFWGTWNAYLKMRHHGNPTFFHVVTSSRAGFKHGMLLSQGSRCCATNRGSELGAMFVAMRQKASDANL